MGVALLLAFRKTSIPPSCTKPHLLPLLVSVSALGITCINICETVRVESIALYLLGVLLVSVGFVALTVGLFSQLSSFPRKEIAPFALAAFVTSHLLGFLDLLPHQVEIWVVLLYPATSSILLLLCLSKSHIEPKPAEVADDGATALSAFYKQTRVLSVVLIFVEILCGAFLQSSYVQGNVGYSASAYTIFIYVVSAAMGLLFYAAAKNAETTTEGALTIGGMGLVCFMVASFFLDVVPIRVLVPLITGTYSALIVFMAALIELWKLDGDADTITCAAAFTILYSSITAITTTIAPQAISLIGFAPAESYASFGAGAGLLASVGVCILLLVTTCSHRESYHAAESSSKQRLHNATSIEHASDEAPHDKLHPVMRKPSSPSANPGASEHDRENDNPHDLAVASLAKKYDLTERERQTVSLITKGYTARKVAEEMAVAVSTVQGYCKSIYKKLGIHRKDDLIEIVESETRTIKE